jgi:peroxiredoxin
MILIDVAGRAHRVGEVPTTAELQAVTGWTLRPEGLCRGDLCRPLRGRTVETGPGADLQGWADVLDLVLVRDAEAGVAALVAAAGAVAPDGAAPDLDLSDVDGRPVSFSEFRGRKRVLVTWASWCGCRHELGAWQALYDELAPTGLALFSVALDDDPEAARPWIEAAAPTYPVAVDTAFVTAERYAIRNVPSVVWVDEHDRIAKPATIAPGDDQFRDWTGIASSRHHDALRRWVRDGTVPATAAPAARTDDDQRALGERRVAQWCFQHGRHDAAARHLARARELAPWDWTIRRGGIQLAGGDPFLGEEFLAFWQEWDAAGRPGYDPT